MPIFKRSHDISELTGYINQNKHLFRAMEGSADADELRHLTSWARHAVLIGEIGFNAGFSSYAFLSSNRRCSVVSFDIGDHEYVKFAKQFIDDTFPGRHQLIVGDSRQTVPDFALQNPKIKFDFIFIDGGHEHDVVKLDIEHMKSLAHKKTIVAIDDLTPWLPWGQGPATAWMEAQETRLILQDELIKDGRPVDQIEPPGERVYARAHYLL